MMAQPRRADEPPESADAMDTYVTFERDEEEEEVDLDVHLTPYGSRGLVGWIILEGPCSAVSKRIFVPKGSFSAWFKIYATRFSQVFSYLSSFTCLRRE